MGRIFENFALGKFTDFELIELDDSCYCFLRTKRLPWLNRTNWLSVYRSIKMGGSLFNSLSLSLSYPITPSFSLTDCLFCGMSDAFIFLAHSLARFLQFLYTPKAKHVFCHSLYLSFTHTPIHTHTHTHTHTWALSLNHTQHIHRHTHTLSQTIFHFTRTFSVFSLSRSHTHSIALSHDFFLSLLHSLTHSLSIALSHTLSIALTHILSLSPPTF